MKEISLYKQPEPLLAVAVSLLAVQPQPCPICGGINYHDIGCPVGK